MTERVTVVVGDGWPIVGCGRRIDDLAIVVAANRVIAVSSPARELGVTAGLRRREAQRRAPGIEVLAPDPAGEARVFEPVLWALEDITPRIEITRPGQCSFLARGPSRYFGGDQAMSDRVAQVVAEVLAGSTTVRVGTADGRFAALRAAALADPDSAHVVAPGASAEFLAPMSIGLLAADGAEGQLGAALDDLVDVLARLGLSTLGAFAALSSADVIARFGAIGARAHRWAQGRDGRPAAFEDPPADLEVAIDLDPPVERVDQAAFVARTLATDFIAALRARGASCARVEILAEAEHGEHQRRMWRSDQALSAAAIADRMRWQLDGWLSGPVRRRPTGGLIRLALRPDDLSAGVGRQLGFWGEQSGLAERAARSVARVQGLAGPGVARVPEVRGGRSPDTEVVAVAAESVDLVERATAVDRALFGGPGADPGAGAAADTAALAWPGRVPPPRPTIIHESPVEVELLDESGQRVTVSGRGVVGADPTHLRFGAGNSGASRASGGEVAKVVGWSGPWLLDEQWWQRGLARRCARMQVVLADGRAFLLAARSRTWFVEATYD